MTTVTRMILTLMLALGIVTAVQAQEASAKPAGKTTTAVAAEDATEAPTETTATTTAAAEPVEVTSHEIRNEFVNLLSKQPSELSTILALDPTLLSNDAFLTGYPELAKFVTEHPGVRRNPRFYLSSFRVPGDESRGLDQTVEAFAMITVLFVVIFALTWLIRTLIEQKRWNRLSRTQSEVHNKILDRFSTSEELLEYVKSSAGAKFLESAPIPLHVDQAPKNSHTMRILWSIQLGVVLAACSIGMLIVSARFGAEGGAGFLAMGLIALCLGAGFIASAFVTLALSRRLGLTVEPSAPGDSPLVRRSEG